MKKSVASVVLILVGIFGLSLLTFIGNMKDWAAPIKLVFQSETKKDSALSKQLSPLPTLTPTPTPRPLTFAELNQRFGPCVVAPTLMYHHIQDLEVAHQQGQASLSVSPEWFRKHMEYLRDRQYSVISMENLVQFFDQGTTLPKKSVLITFDDGYTDFATNALPILKELGYPATLFAPTGLMDNPGYLTWVEIGNLGSSFLVANHTWSHQSAYTSKEVMAREIAVADQQLKDRGLNNPKVFAYPYGSDSMPAETELRQQGYLLGFTTQHSLTQCQKKRLQLPRIRVGNAPLSAYGL